MQTYFFLSPFMHRKSQIRFFHLIMKYTILATSVLITTQVARIMINPFESIIAVKGTSDPSMKGVTSSLTSERFQTYQTWDARELGPKSESESNHNQTIDHPIL